jgi:hypothetical protein
LKMQQEAVQQLLRRVRAETIEETLNQVDAGVAALETELRGLLLVNYILVQRLGGVVTITAADVKGVPEEEMYLRVTTDPESGDRTFTTFKTNGQDAGATE